MPVGASVGYYRSGGAVGFIDCDGMIDQVRAEPSGLGLQATEATAT